MELSDSELLQLENQSVVSVQDFLAESYLSTQVEQVKTTPVVQQPLKAKSAKKGTFRINSSQVFLTYPQCTLSKEELLDCIMKTAETILKVSIVQYVIAQEKHEDGSPHLHAYIKFSKKIDRDGCKLFDYHGFHPNIESKIKSINAVKKYVKKDNNYIEYGINCAEKFKAADGKKKYIGSELIGGARLVDVVKENPELIFEYGSIQRNLDLYFTDLARDKPTCADAIPNPWGLEMNILKCKQKHYWVWSKEPNLGKTTSFLLPLMESYRCTMYSYQENFQNIYSDSQFLLFDEYSSAHLKVTQLNQMCDGTYQFPRKGGSPVVCKDITLIICGNKHPKDIYTTTFDYIAARFNVFELKKAAETIDTVPEELNKPYLGGVPLVSSQAWEKHLENLKERRKRLGMTEMPFNL